MVAVAVGAVLVVAGNPLSPTPASASSPPASDFEAPSHALGSVDGQNGWGAQDLAIPVNASLDQAVVVNAGAPVSFGGQSWRFSNAYTTGSFGDQVFSPSAPDEAGETSAEGGGLSGGTRQSRFAASGTSPRRSWRPSSPASASPPAPTGATAVSGP